MALIRIDRPHPSVAVLTMNRGGKLNAFDDGLLDALTAACIELHDDARTKAVVVTGGTRVFSAGADVGLFDAIQSETDVNRVRRTLNKGKRMIELWETLPMPTIAAVEGGAVGGGFTLALACDWRVFAEQSFAMIPEVKLGLNYGWGTLPRLTALAGPARAKWMSILCRRHDAAQLEHWGIADLTAPRGQALDAALKLAQEVAALPMLAPQIIKRSVDAYAHALSRSTSTGDMDDMLVCMGDREGASARRDAVSALGSR
jgi:enoyl-CoA hydratase/carnithine racemase